MQQYCQNYQLFVSYIKPRGNVTIILNKYWINKELLLHQIELPINKI